MAKKTDFGDAAGMGAAMTSLFAVRGGFPIHCQSDEKLDFCERGVLARGLQRRALWLGNSQLHAVNQLREGERNGPDLLSERLAGRSIDLGTSLLMAAILGAWLTYRTHFRLAVHSWRIAFALECGGVAVASGFVYVFLRPVAQFIYFQF